MSNVCQNCNIFNCSKLVNIDRLYAMENATNSCLAPSLGSTMHYVSVLGSVVNIHRSNKIDIQNHTFINNGQYTHYKVHI